VAVTNLSQYLTVPWWLSRLQQLQQTAITVWIWWWVMLSCFWRSDLE
jgi:hypothetical protein